LKSNYSIALLNLLFMNQYRQKKNTLFSL